MSEAGFVLDLPKGNSSIIKVIGVGGGGNNALKHMYEKGIKGVDFIVCNTDAQALNENPVPNKIQLGIKETEGLGAGADPEVGKRAAQESIDDIKAKLGSNTKMVFITAGMGGGTGTGAAPVIAKTAKDMGILTVGIVTVPFSFEGPRRLKQAEEGLEELRASVDSLIVINNDKLRQQFGNLGFKSGFAKADEVLANAAKGMAEVIMGYFIVNIDFRDAKSVLQNSGTALMSEGIASGENKAEEAVKRALDSPLLNDNKITGAKNVLLLIKSGNQEVTMDEVGLINDYIQKEAGNSADIILGIGIDEKLEDDISVLVIATGFNSENQKTIGFSERISIPLSGERSNPISTTSDLGNSMASRVVPSSQPENIQKTEISLEKKVFKLTDDDARPNIPTNPTMDLAKLETIETETLVEDEIPKGFNIFEEENAQTSIAFGEEKETLKEEKKAYDLFSYGELEPVSYTFDLDDESKREEKTLNTDVEFQDIEGRFLVQQEEQTPTFTVSVKEEVELLQNPEPIVEETPKFFEVEQREEFTIIEKKKTEEDVKILERRNKLKEFNSRYHTAEEDNSFEAVPAFKRRNISLNLENSSEQRISNYITEEKGKIELRENKFLNREVD